MSEAIEHARRVYADLEKIGDEMHPFTIGAALKEVLDEHDQSYWFDTREMEALAPNDYESVSLKFERGAGWTVTVHGVGLTHSATEAVRIAKEKLAD